MIILSFLGQIENWVPEGPSEDEAVCVNCQNNSYGDKCESCLHGYFLLDGKCTKYVAGLGPLPCSLGRALGGRPRPSPQEKMKSPGAPRPGVREELDSDGRPSVSEAALMETSGQRGLLTFPGPPLPSEWSVQAGFWSSRCTYQLCGLGEGLGLWEPVFSSGLR